jgi:two-component system nitrogen regulation sensor histidine kinase NtrY
VASLVEAFGAMSAALGAQRADLVRSRDYMAALLRHATLGIVSTGADGRIVTLNPMAAALLEGPDGPPGIGTPLRPAVEGVPGLAPLATAFASAAFRDGLPVEIDVERSGEPLRLRAVRAPLPDPAGGDPGSLILLDDVTDLMVRNQLAAWAEMARAIAHEIKNPLTPIRLSAQHLERLLRDRGVLPSEDVNTCLETILKQVEALREISADFSAFAKLPELRRTPLGAAPFLRDILAPYAAMSPAGVVVVQRVAPDCEILADPRVLGRALINLIENALQAMPGGGTLTVGARPDPPTRGAVVFVADTGPGLDPDVRRHLFEPYFSTKSSGTGLGLSIVKRSVEAHGGSIEVESAPDRGTTFSLHLPGD